MTLSKFLKKWLRIDVGEDQEQAELELLALIYRIGEVACPYCYHPKLVGEPCKWTPSGPNSST